MEKNNMEEDDKKLIDKFADIKRNLIMLNNKLVVELEKEKEASNKVDAIRRRKAVYYNQIEYLGKDYFKDFENTSGEIAIDDKPPFSTYQNY